MQSRHLQARQPIEKILIQKTYNIKLRKQNKTILTSPGETWGYALKDWNTEKKTKPIQVLSYKVSHQIIIKRPRNIRFYSFGWPTEKESTLAGLPTSRCMKKVIHKNTSNE